jgi:hypothetical protein
MIISGGRCSTVAEWLWARLKEIAAMDLDREELLMKLGAARAKARVAWRLVDVALAWRLRVTSGGLGPTLRRVDLRQRTPPAPRWLPSRAMDRDRGEPRGSAPPTPPCRLPGSITRHSMPRALRNRANQNASYPQTS